jgi:hypothetical protein
VVLAAEPPSFPFATSELDVTSIWRVPGVVSAGQWQTPDGPRGRSGRADLTVRCQSVGLSQRGLESAVVGTHQATT